MGVRDMGSLLGDAAGWAVNAVHSLGYPGVFVLVTMGNLYLLVPTHLSLPLFGFLVGQGRFSFPGVLAAATAGSVAASLVLYALGRWLGEERVRRLVERFGRLARLKTSDLDKASATFERHGGKAIMFGRLVPGVGALISIPAGIVRMPPVLFVLYVAIGSGMWNGALIGLGWVLGARWGLVERYAPIVEYAVLALLAAGIVLFVWRRRRGRRPPPTGPGS